MGKIRRLLSLSVVASLILAMTLGSVENTYAKDNKKDKKEASGKESFEEKEIPVFKGELTDETITIRYYEASPHVPYIGIKEYYDCVIEDSLDGEETMSVKKNKDNTYSLKSAHGEALVDVEKGVMTSDNMGDFTNLMCLIQEGMNKCYVDGIPYARVKDTVITGDGSAEYDFAKYNIKIYGDDEDVYFPESTLSDIFTDMVYHYSVCNGETFYFNCKNPCFHDNIADLDPDYAKPIMETLDSNFNRPEDMAEFAYNELCFSFDYLYGLPGKGAINDDIREKGLEQALIDYGKEGEKTVELLKSRDYAEYMCGLSKLSLFVGDGGHTRTDSVNLANAGPEELNKKIAKINEDLDPLYKNSQKENEESEEFWNHHLARTKLRDNAYKGEKYIKEGDTAIFVLDSFVGFDMDKWNKYYKEGGAKPTVLTMRNDDMLLISECIKDAADDPDIKNFVVDCSNNTGGSLDEVAMLYCLITGKRDVHLKMENSLTGQKVTETYEADTNFDGKFDENDEKEPYDLNFAVLTSKSSFSCGNVFPSVMKDAGYMIMGEQSGGGACAVMVQTTGEGMTYRMSTYMGRFINKDDEIIDNGVEVDVDLIPKRSNGKDRFITVKDVTGYDGKKADIRIPDYSDFYNISRLSEEMNRFYE